MAIVTLNDLDQIVSTANLLYPSKKYNLVSGAVDSIPHLKLVARDVISNLTYFEELPAHNRPNHLIVERDNLLNYTTTICFPLTKTGDIIKIAEELERIVTYSSFKINESYDACSANAQDLLIPSVAYEVMSKLMRGASESGQYDVHVGSGSMYIPAGDMVTYKVNYVDGGVTYTYALTRNIYFDGGITGPVVEYVNDSLWLSSTAKGMMRVPTHILTESLHNAYTADKIYDTLKDYYVSEGDINVQ